MLTTLLTTSPDRGLAVGGVLSLVRERLGGLLLFVPSRREELRGLFHPDLKVSRRPDE